MNANYRLLCYLHSTKGSLCIMNIFSGQKIPNFNVPIQIEIINKGYDPDKRYILEFESLFDKSSTIAEFNKNEWLLNEIESINLHNSNVNNKNKILNNRKFNVPPIPEGLVIDQLRWELLLGTIELGKYIIFTGPTGAGKTTAAKALADALGYDFYPLNCGVLDRPKSSLIGSMQAQQGSTFLKESEFLSFFKSEKPTIILLDEVSRIPPAAAKAFMTILDRGQSYIYVDDLGERIYKGKNVIFIATANFGIQYVDTRRMDNALLNRFIPFHMNYLPAEDEIKLINYKTPNLNQVDVQRLVRHANILRNNYDTLGMEVSHRQIIDFSQYFSLGFNYQEVLEELLINIFLNGPDDKRDQAIQILNAKP